MIIWRYQFYTYINIPDVIHIYDVIYPMSLLARTFFSAPELSSSLRFHIFSNCYTGIINNIAPGILILINTMFHEDHFTTSWNYLMNMLTLSIVNFSVSWIYWVDFSLLIRVNFIMLLFVILLDIISWYSRIIKFLDIIIEV